MTRRCEVCVSLEALAAVPTPPRKLRRMLAGERVLVLCDEHAAEVQGASTGDLSALRQHFQEPEGERSLVERRAPVDRRVFPPRPEGRRRGQGRRAMDRREA